MRAGVIGLGDMGSGLAKNLIKNGFETTGFDLSDARMSALKEMGGKAASSVVDVAKNADIVYVMVMNGDQAKNVILGPDGLVENMAAGGAVVLTATIKPREATEIGAAMEGSGIALIDSPVSGGFHGRARRHTDHDGSGSGRGSGQVCRTNGGGVRHHSPCWRCGGQRSNCESVFANIDRVHLFRDV